MVFDTSSYVDSTANRKSVRVLVHSDFPILPCCRCWCAPRTQGWTKPRRGLIRHIVRNNCWAPPHPPIPLGDSVASDYHQNVRLLVHTVLIVLYCTGLLSVPNRPFCKGSHITAPRPALRLELIRAAQHPSSLVACFSRFFPLRS